MIEKRNGFPPLEQRLAPSKYQQIYDQQTTTWDAYEIRTGSYMQAHARAASQSMQQAQLGQQLGYTATEDHLRNALAAHERQHERLLTALGAAGVAVSISANGVIGIVTKTKQPSVCDLARALWCSDERVYRKAAEVGDYTINAKAVFAWMETNNRSLVMHNDGPKRAAVLQKMWDRDESGWRTEAMKRAESIHLLLEKPSRMDVAPVPQDANGPMPGYNPRTKL